MAHTYGPTCHLARSVTFSGSKGVDDIPELKAQFFYSSPLPIDDPLSAVPAPSGSDSKAAKHPSRPFSAYDNNALEEAWLGLASEKDWKHHNKGRTYTKLSSKPNTERRISNAGGQSNKGDDQPVPEERIRTPSPASPAPDGVRHSKRQAHTEAVKEAKDAKKAVKSTSDSSPKDSSRPSIITNSQGQKTVCFCKGGQDSCQNNLGKCACGAYPNANSGAKPVTDKAVLPIQDKSNSKNEKIKASGKGKTANDAKAAHPEEAADTKESLDPKSSKKPKSSNPSQKLSDVEKDRIHTNTPGSQESGRKAVDLHGNPSNSHCDDPNHILLDSPLIDCCKELEIKAKPIEEVVVESFKADEHLHSENEQSSKDTASKAKKHKSEKHIGKGKHVAKSDVGERQGNGADNCACVQSEGAEQKNNGHKAFEKHTRSGRQKPFEGHLQEAHDGHYIPSSPQRDGRPHSRSKQEKALEIYEPAHILGILQVGEAGTSGTPFLKLPSRTNDSRSQSPSPPAQDGAENQRPLADRSGSIPVKSVKTHERDSTEIEVVHDHACRARKHKKDFADVPVGISRLHLVKLPELLMKPIYWSPVHDIASVTRGTWFYKDSMYPVEPAVANQLEMGYRELRAWSKTWSEELNSAIEVGAAGEEKISHRLWSREGTSHSMLSTNPTCAAKCFRGEAAAEGCIDLDASLEKSSGSPTIAKKYPNSHVIYKDAQNAFILKPNLVPSVYYGRKPLQNIKKGTTVGIHVIRGFDWRTWEKLHPSKKSIAAFKAEENAPVAGDADANKRNKCVACRAQEERPNVTDLVLVIHGIGQKLSERVESFHFTHAINSFRRSVNIELGNEAVHRVLREDLGLMVLPVNWRSNLSFEEGGPMRDEDKAHANAEFSLRDITPTTIPAVRNLISDVMLDIPFYMSHHKPKMIQAVISEANRVYRLWCQNNPDFHNKGRVHIIAHSLGSAMAAEVLSKQPTFVPKYDPRGRKTNTKYFDFNTTNLFFVGSPAGFFLLLEKGKLIPRRSRNKAGAEAGDDNGKDIVGDPGLFGCLAVDNIYNIMNYNDPIAYRLNATVDPQYAANLKNAQVPTATVGFFEAIGRAMKSMTPGISPSAELDVGQVVKPPGIARLPSTLEMEVHDFTREEIAEKKFHLLNDNGQVDWFLSSGGGPLEIQYINMLGAHSSYWVHPDFIRMIVVEVGRKPGRGNALPNMKAVKLGPKAERSVRSSF